MNWDKFEDEDPNNEVPIKKEVKIEEINNNNDEDDDSIESACCWVIITIRISFVP